MAEPRIELTVSARWSELVRAVHELSHDGRIGDGAFSAHDADRLEHAARCVRDRLKRLEPKGG